MSDPKFLVELQSNDDSTPPKSLDLKQFFDEMLDELGDESIQALSEAMADAGAVPSRKVTGSFRALLRANEWRGGNNSLGASYEHMSQFQGRGDAPSWCWYHRGFMVEQGETIKSLSIWGRASASLSAMKYHWTFRTGDWNNSLDSNAETEFTDVFVGEMDVSTPGNDQSKMVITSDFTAPSDGVLMPSFSIPSGSNRYFYGDYIVEIQP